MVTAALKAARRVNDYPTAVRIFEGALRTIIHDISSLTDGTNIIFSILGIKAKVENRGQYDQYLAELKEMRESLGVNLKEDLYPELP